MCCTRPNEEDLLARQQQWRQQKAVKDLAAAIDNAELPEVKGVSIESKNDDNVPGFRQKRTNG
jgi:hypothetical protein